MRAISTVMLLGLVIWAGCASPAVTSLRDERFQSSMIKSLACTPFIKGRECGTISSREDAFLDCRLSAVKHTPEHYAPEAIQEISAALHAELKKKYGLALKDYTASLAVFDDIARAQPESTLRSLTLAFADALGVAYVVIGVLDSYIERQGTARGISSPASVAFRLYLVHAPTGATIFEGSFSETQQALSENVLKAPAFFKRGARWLSAEELAREGIAAILADIP